MSRIDCDLNAVLDQVRFDDRGLAVAMVQDAETGQALMCAFVNREALVRTLETRRMHYWSRSRGRLWLKGETSGHVQNVREVRIDCDGDALLFRVEQTGGACHTGYFSCFHRRLDADGWRVDGHKVFDPNEVY
jgi:phosphoribosyl-AMP cyclohydrolase